MSWIDFVKNIIEPKEFNIRFLETIDKSKWPSIWCSLNCWNIPEELQAIKPEWWDSEGDKVTRKHDFNYPLMLKIEKSFSQKDLLREWNKERMTPSQFELWWQHRGDEDYFEYWDKKIFPENHVEVTN